MSDYLENLAARTLNRIEGIQPRVASLFEPLPPAGRPMTARLGAHEESVPGEPFSSGSSHEASLSTQESFSNADQSRPHTMDRGQPVATLPQQPTGMTDTSMHQPPGQWVNRQPSPPLSSSAVDTASGQRPTQPGPHLARTMSTATPAASSTPGAARPLDAITAQPSDRGTPILMPVTAEQAPAAGPSTPTARHESLPAPEHIVSRAVDKRAVSFDVPQSRNITHPESVSDHARRSSTPAMPAGQPRVTVYRESPGSIPGDGIAMPEPAPTIKVTIGRVDVRAIMTPAPAARPAPARRGPSLSLDDYLKQRGGGRQ
jgi:hypothetical protein